VYILLFDILIIVVSAIFLTLLYSWNAAGTANVSSNHLDLFGLNLMDDLVDIAASTSTAMLNVGSADVSETDLFADADFQSATASGSYAQVCFSGLVIYF
jgi:predicted SpoU family rRNA methylase